MGHSLAAIVVAEVLIFAFTVGHAWTADIGGRVPCPRPAVQFRALSNSRAETRSVKPHGHRAAPALATDVVAKRSHMRTG
jgi:hypothetical protein